MEAAVVAALCTAAVACAFLAGLAAAKARTLDAARTPKADVLDGKLTASWRLAELGKPLVIARDLDAEAPAGARIVASGQVTAQALHTAQVRQVPDVPAEFALDEQQGRALLFLGGVRPGALAWRTNDPAIVARLGAEARRAWDSGVPYRESLPVAALPARIGIDVETQGLVEDVLPHQGAFLLRLAEGESRLGVRVAKDASDLRGQRVLVRGRMQRDGAGYPVLVATDLRPLE